MSGWTFAKEVAQIIKAEPKNVRSQVSKLDDLKKQELKQAVKDKDNTKVSNLLKSMPAGYPNHGNKQYWRLAKITAQQLDIPVQVARTKLSQLTNEEKSKIAQNPELAENIIGSRDQEKDFQVLSLLQDLAQIEQKYGSKLLDKAYEARAMLRK